MPIPAAPSRQTDATQSGCANFITTKQRNTEKQIRLEQEQIDLALSHVNAYIRQSQSDRTPYDVFEFIRGEGVAAKLRIAKIDPRKVSLKPRLVGIEMK